MPERGARGAEGKTGVGDGGVVRERRRGVVRV